MVEDSKVLEACLLHKACMENYCVYVLIESSGGQNLVTMLQNACVYIIFFFLYCGVDSPSLGFTVHLSFTLCISSSYMPICLLVFPLFY